MAILNTLTGQTIVVALNNDRPY